MDTLDRDKVFHLLFQNEGSNYENFFDAAFGFLFRKTDFFKNITVTTSGIDYEMCKNCVLKSLGVYIKRHINDLKQASYDACEEKQVIDEVEVAYEEEAIVEVSTEEIAPQNPSTELKKIVSADSESYNGDIVENRKWSQDLHDVEVYVNVPHTIIHSDQVKVNIQPSSLTIDILNSEKWENIATGEFPHTVKSIESNWTLHGGKYLYVALHKVKDIWWDCMFVGDPKIDLQKIEACLPYEDLDEDSQAKIRELMYDQHQKRLGRPTIVQKKMSNILSEAWNAKGSPFSDQPFDPNLIIPPDLDPMEKMQ